jgi:UDP-N-acetylmuramate--alanine ligase
MRQKSPQRAHLVGIAGNGMRAMAEVLVGRGWRVSGSDLQLPEGHHAENVPPDAEVVIVSDAVPATNVELQRAAELGIPTLSYFQMLGRISADCHTMAVAGTHGKSTVTAMTARVLIETGVDPTVFCGATPLGATSGGLAGNGRIILVEACEYRANFLHLRPHHAAILNIEPDHFDCYDSPTELEKAFQQFTDSIPANGLLVVRCDDAAARRVASRVACRIETFGLEPEADWSASNMAENQGRFHFNLVHSGSCLGRVQLKTPGLHNVQNALAAAALAAANGVTPEHIIAGLGHFAGLHRRLEVLGTWRGVTVIDDYAHHPTEITAALAAVRQMFPHRRVWCVFQPHQAGRTARLLDELAASLQNADNVMVAEIFRAREGAYRPGEVTATDLAAKTRQLGVEVLPGHRTEEILEMLETHLVAGDVLVTLGAGDVAKLRPSIRDEGLGARGVGE